MLRFSLFPPPLPLSLSLNFSLPPSHSFSLSLPPSTHSIGPGNNEICDHDGSDPRDLDDGDEDDDDDEFRRELDEDDRQFFDRIEGAEDRLRAFSIQASADTEPCAEGFRCTGSGDAQRCTMITGSYFILYLHDIISYIIA